MEQLEYSIEIEATREQVWDSMLQPTTYREWVNASWPDSFYEGKWVEGTTIRFISAGGGGTAAVVKELKQFHSIELKHVAMINPDGSEDTTSDSAKGWIGTLERYTFHEKDGKTTVNVTMETTPEWIDMFEEGWPAALEKLKEVCERQAKEQLVKTSK
jgi:uncharacterized protein YndB with AHSA1/START domain